MLQKPNTVFVAKKFNAAGATLVAGDVFVVDAATGNAIDLSSTNAIAATVSNIKLKFVKSDGSVTTSSPIGKKNITNITPDAGGAYVAKVEASSVIDFTSATITAGHRYVIRCIYKDIYEHPGQFTHSYEVIAAAGETINTIGAKFAARVNAHVGARVTATYADLTNILLLTAKEVTPNGYGTQGKEAITPYSQVILTVVAFTTIVDSRFNSAKDAFGVTITTTQSKPGKGNPYIVRDREQAALAYKGITNRITWPIIKPELNVDLSKTYDTLTIEFKNQYQSPDNQYVKETQLAAEVYVEAGATASAETLGDKIRAWIVA
jgi:hypothetical protein